MRTAKKKMIMGGLNYFQRNNNDVADVDLWRTLNENQRKWDCEIEHLQKELKGRDTRMEMVYRNNALEKTFEFLEANNYNWIKEPRSGNFGSIMEVEDPSTGRTLAAKIIIKNFVGEGEIRIWPTLRHKNILPLMTLDYIISANSYLFMMPIHPRVLDEVAGNPRFAFDPKSLARTVHWIKGIVEGVNYLHARQLCHLDLNPDNVLVTRSDEAVICGFRALTHTAAGIDSYSTAAFVFRPPEAVISSDKLNRQISANVNGFKFDIWTLGILTLALFTFPEFDDLLSSVSPKFTAPYLDPKPWVEDVYPEILKLLQERFDELARETFKMCQPTTKMLNTIVNFIKGCVKLNPRERCTIHEALNHKLLGGRKTFTITPTDIWEEKGQEQWFICSQIKMYIREAETLPGEYEDFVPITESLPSKPGRLEAAVESVMGSLFGTGFQCCLDVGHFVLNCAFEVFYSLSERVHVISVNRNRIITHTNDSDELGDDEDERLSDED